MPTPSGGCRRLVRWNTFPPLAIAVGDLNRDGDLDVVTANKDADSVSLLLGQGTGAFAPARPIRVGDEPVSAAVADLDGDGNQDLVTANSGASSVTVRLGRGDGTFVSGPGPSPKIGANPRAIAVGDLDGDGNADLVAANPGDGTVSVLLGDGPSPNDANMLVNPGAEGPGASGTRAGAPAVPGWTRTSGAPTFVRYAIPEFPGFIDAARWAGGANLFAGGIGPAASMNQTISVADRAALIDAGRLSARLSGSLGGHAAENDSARLSAKFFDATKRRTRHGGADRAVERGRPQEADGAPSPTLIR